MEQTTAGFTLDTLLRKKIEKLRRKAKDARIHQRLSALLWLNQDYSAQQVADLLGVCPRTVHNWVALCRAALRGRRRRGPQAAEHPGGVLPRRPGVPGPALHGQEPQRAKRDRAVRADAGPAPRNEVLPHLPG